MNKNNRDKLYSWFNKALLKLPDRTSNSSIIVSGTPLHHDSLIKRIEVRDDFNVFKFPLILQFPSNLESISPSNLSSLDLKDMKLDDPKISKLEILKEYLDDPNSVASEYKNEPFSKEFSLFKAHKEYENMPVCDLYCIGLDPALGKERGDFFGLTLLGFKKSENKFYAKSMGYKLPLNQMTEIIINLYTTYSHKPITIAAESVAFQEFYAQEIKNKAKLKGIFLHLKPIKNHSPKDLRIHSLSSPLEDETILIQKDCFLLKEELNTYPLSSHDDLLDSLEIAYSFLKEQLRFSYADLKEILQESHFNFKSSKYQ